MLVLLLACVVLHYAWCLFSRKSPWPRRFLAGIARWAGVRISLVGDRCAGQSVILANHVSWIDIPALASATGAGFVAHDGLAAVPVVRWLCELNGTVFIARHARASIAAQVDQVRDALAVHDRLVIFPEGTTSDGTGLLPFKSSLLSAFDPLPPGIAVQPVLLDYGQEAADIAWVGEEAGLTNFLRILGRKRPIQLRLHFLPPLASFGLEGRKAMAASAQALIAQRLDQRVAL